MSFIVSLPVFHLSPFSALTIFFLPVMLITLFHPPFPFLHYEILISYSLSFGHGPWIMHLSLPLFLHTPLSFSLALPDLHLLTRFPSLLPPQSVSQRRSDKIRPLTLFVFTLIPHSLLCPVVLCFFSSSRLLSLEYAEWNFMVLYVTWAEPWLVRRVWRKGDKSARMFKCVFIGPVVVRAWGVCCNSLKSTPDKPASVARGGVYRLWHDTVHDWPLKIPDVLHINAENLFLGWMCHVLRDTVSRIETFHPLNSTTHSFTTFVLRSFFFLSVPFLLCCSSSCCCFFQVEVKSKKEVSLLDLDDCEFICSFPTVNDWISSQ